MTGLQEVELLKAESILSFMLDPLHIVVSRWLILALTKLKYVLSEALQPVELLTVTLYHPLVVGEIDWEVAPVFQEYEE